MPRAFSADYDEFEGDKDRLTEEDHFWRRENIYLAPQKPEELEHELVTLPRRAAPFHLEVPKGYSRLGRDSILHFNFGFRYLTERSTHAWRTMDLENFKGAIERFEANLEGSQLKRSGSVEMVDDNVLRLNLPIRRGGGLTDMEAAKGFFYYSTQFMEEDIWTAAYYTHEFYPHYIHPYFDGDETTDPFEWALKRAEVANGYGLAMGMSFDFSPEYAEFSFKKLAALACNKGDEALSPPREYSIESTERQLIIHLEEALGKPPEPELLCFVLENAENLSGADLKNPTFRSYLQNFNRCLENGLIIDRLNEFFKRLLEKGVGPSRALDFSFSLVTKVFGGEKEPWWFKENFDLVEIFDEGEDACKVAGGTLKIGVCEEGIALIEKVALSGFAFTYALQAYKWAGFKLRNFEGIDEDIAINFTNRLVATYGIGNPRRAVNLIEFALELLRDANPADRPAALELFEKHAARYRPTTEIIGRMEGSETTMRFPGIFSLLASNLDNKKLEREKLDEVTVTARHLIDLAAPLTRPLLERAKTTPSVRVPVDKNRRLLAANQEGRLALPVSEEARLASVTESPLFGIFNFYQRLREECEYVDEEVAECYFAFMSSKMPDPFNPPKGFLRFLQKYVHMPTPGYRASILEHPSDRSRANEANAKRLVSKYMVVANLLDTWVIGLLNKDQLLEIFRWMTQDPTEDERLGVEEKVRAEREKSRVREARYRDEHPEDMHYGDESTSDPVREEEWIKSDTESQLRRTSEQLWTKRSIIAQKALDQLVMVNILMALNLIPREEAKIIFEDMVTFFTDQEVHQGLNYPAIDGHEEDGFDSPSAEFGQLKTLDELTQYVPEIVRIGLFNRAAFTKQFSDGDAKKRRQLIYDFAALVENFILTIDKIREFDGELLDKDYSEIPEDLLGKIQKFALELEKLWKSTPSFVVDSPVDHLLDTYLKVEKFVYLLAVLKAFRNERTPNTLDITKLREEALAIAEVTRVSVSIIGSMAALHDLRPRSLAAVTSLALPAPEDVASLGDNPETSPANLRDERGLLRTVSADIANRLASIYPEAKR